MKRGVCILIVFILTFLSIDTNICFSLTQDKNNNISRTSIAVIDKETAITPAPTKEPSPTETIEPITAPSIEPAITSEPTAKPTIKPSVKPKLKPTVKPTNKPKVLPTVNSKSKSSKGTPLKPAFKSASTQNPTRTVNNYINFYPQNTNKVYVLNCSPTSSIRIYKDKELKIGDGIQYGNVPVKLIARFGNVAKIVYTRYASSSQRIGFISYNQLRLVNVNKKYLIEVDLSKKEIHILKDNKSFKCIRCTVGKRSTPTMRGVYLISGRKPTFSTETCSVKTATRIVNGYYFHSILYNLRGTHIIDSRLGQNLSHGCIRLSIPDARFIYNQIPNNTLVIIV